VAEIKYLRDLVSKFAMSNNPMMMHVSRDTAPPVTGYYGDGQDDLVSYDDYGNEIIVNETQIKKE